MPPQERLRDIVADIDEKVIEVGVVLVIGLPAAAWMPIRHPSMVNLVIGLVLLLCTGIIAVGIYNHDQ